MPPSSPSTLPSPRSARWTAFAPAAVALLFAGWCGTFYFGASAFGAIAAHLVLVGLGAAGVAVCAGAGADAGSDAGKGVASEARFDPLALGPAGRLLPAALLATVALAWWTSPVPRAGRVGLVLLPALLVLPPLFAICWSGGRRGLASRALAVAVAGVSLWGLVSWLVGPEPLPAEPLGHHLFFAAWIVTLLPLAALPLRETGPRRDLARGLGAAALLAGVAAVLATRSLAGGLALAVEGGLLLGTAGRRHALAGGLDRVSRSLRRWPFVWALAAVAVVLAIAALQSSADPSLRARLVYWRAGWAGVLERPWTGFGPGSTAWTLAAFLRPVPGVNPPGEVVGELHLLPLAVAYEIGVVGLALTLAIGWVFARRRFAALAPPDRRDGEERDGEGAGTRSPVADPELTLAAMTGLAGALVMGLATADWRIGALPVAVAIAAGAALAGSRRLEEVSLGGDVDGGTPGSAGPAGGSGPAKASSRSGGAGRWPALALALAFVCAAGIVLVPLDRAELAYERFVQSPDGVGSGATGPGGARQDRSAAALNDALRLDPTFPLYRFQAARWAWLSATAGPSTSRRQAAWQLAREALGAAGDARGVAALWLRGGAAAAAAGRRGIAATALETACGLDPLGALAPFSLMTVDSPLYRRDALGARALAAEPRLAAALFWRDRPQLLERALEALSAAEGIDAGWREQVVSQVRALSRQPMGPGSPPVASVALVVDGRAASSLSLHAFRRLPRRVALVPVPVIQPMAQALSSLPPATALPGTDPRLFPPTCTGPFSPQTLRKTLWKTW